MTAAMNEPLTPPRRVAATPALTTRLVAGYTLATLFILSLASLFLYRGLRRNFEIGVFLFADLAEIEAHLAGEELFAEVGVVVQLGIHRRRDLVEDEAQAADEHGVENEHQSEPVNR